MNSASEAELRSRREHIRRGLRRANAAALLALLIVVALSLAAIRQGFHAQYNAQEAAQAQHDAQVQMEQARAAEARALLEQARALRRTGEMGQRFASLDAASQAAAIAPSLELRHEVVAALALPDVTFVPVWTNRSPNLVAQFSLDTELLAVGGSEGSIDIMRIGDRRRDVLPSVAFAVRRLAFSPDGRFLAAEYSGGTNVVWEISQSRMVRMLDAPESFRAFGPQSQNIIVSDGTGMVRCLQIIGGKEIWRCRTGWDWPEVRVQPSGKYFTVSSGGETNVQVRNVATGALVCEISQSPGCGHAAWSPDGTTLAIGRDGGWIDTWQTESWTRTGNWKAHDDTVVNLAFEPGGARLASSSWDGTVHFWSLPGFQSELSASGYQGQSMGRFSPNGRRYGCVREGEVVGFLQVAQSPALRRFYVPPTQMRGAWALDVTTDGKLLAAGYEDGLLLLDFTTGARLDWKPVVDCRSVWFTGDGEQLVTCGASGIACWGIVRGTGSVRLGESRALPERREPVHGALSADGQWFAAAIRSEGLVAVHNLQNPAESFDLTNHSRVQFIALSENGSWLASGTWKGTGVKLWDLRSRQFIRELPVNKSALVAFSPDSKLLITGARHYQVWECGSWRERYVHQGIGLEGGPAAFSPDSRIVAVMKNPHTMELLEAATGRVLAELEPPGSTPIWLLRFSPDGQSLLALECQGQIQVWDLNNVHQELARMGLDWEIEGQAGPGGKGDSRMNKTVFDASNTSLTATPFGQRSAVAKPGSAFYSLALGGVLFSVLIGIYILRYNYRMIRSYEEVETLVTQGNEELRSARMELLHSQKMRALGTLAAGIAHDFNNLLSVIRMSNKLVARKSTDRSGIEEHVSDIESAVLQGKSLVGSMLGYARNETVPNGLIDVNAVVENAVSLLSKEFLSGITLTLELDRRAPKVQLGHSRVEQILLNLLVNASEAMEAQGKLMIRLQTRSSLPPKAYVIRPLPANEFLELTVIDSGPGIAPEIRERLFEPFFTTKNSRSKPGTGLGLSLVYAIAQEDGLGLCVENGPERGAVFSVVIPVNPLAPVRQSHSSQIAINA